MKIVTRGKFMKVMYALEAPVLPLVVATTGKSLEECKREVVMNLNYEWEEGVPLDQKVLQVYTLKRILRRAKSMRQGLSCLKDHDVDFIDEIERLVDIAMNEVRCLVSDE